MPIISPIRFAHVVYRTRRFEQMVHWYETVYGARVRYQNPAMAFPSYDDEHHRFALVNLSLLQPDGTESDRHGVIGVDHVAYTYPSLTDLLENYSQLREKGIRPYWCIHHGVTVSMYYADPDGNQIECQVNCFDSEDDANAFMHGPGFSANPIGVEYDPDDWLARLRAGALTSAFLVRQRDDPVSPLRGALAVPRRACSRCPRRDCVPGSPPSTDGGRSHDDRGETGPDTGCGCLSADVHDGEQSLDPPDRLCCRRFVSRRSLGRGSAHRG
jgi:catechol 2,3-dioxygenase-like lactoylglutathione lyase family enzyme